MKLRMNTEYYIQSNDKPLDIKFKVLGVNGDTYTISKQNKEMVLSLDELLELGLIREAKKIDFNVECPECKNFGIIMKYKPLLKGLPIDYDVERDSLIYDKDYWQITLKNPITKKYNRYKVNKKDFRKYINSPLWMSPASELKNTIRDEIDFKNLLLKTNVTEDLLKLTFPNSDKSSVTEYLKDESVRQSIIDCAKNKYTNVSVINTTNNFSVFAVPDECDMHPAQLNRYRLIKSTSYPFSFSLREDAIEQFIECGGLISINNITCKYDSDNSKMPHALSVRQKGYYDKFIRSFIDDNNQLSTGIIYDVSFDHLVNHLTDSEYILLLKNFKIKI